LEWTKPSSVPPTNKHAAAQTSRIIAERRCKNPPSPRLWRAGADRAMRFFFIGESYGRGAGVGRDLGLGVGLKAGEAVGVGVGGGNVAVGVAVGVGVNGWPQL